MAPSPLDRPRFADDEPLSVWNADGREVVAGAQAFDELVPFRHVRFERWPSEIESTDSRPIAVEFVRNARGVKDNAWTVIVDGVRCDLQPLPYDPEGGYDPADDLPTCVLPTPVHTTDNGRDGLARDNEVRSVAIGVRLEQEALAPAKVEILVQEIVDSKERVQKTNGLGTDQEILTIYREELKPYTMRDSMANAVVTPYPFAAPPHAALAIASYREVEKMKEKIQQINWDNEEKQTDYLSKKAKYDREHKAWAVSNAKAVTNYNNEMVRYNGNPLRAGRVNEPRPSDFQEQWGVKPDGTALYTQSGDKWNKLVPTERAPRGLPEETVEKDRSYIVGGRSTSAPRELVDLFDKLTYACNYTAMPQQFDGDQRNYGASMKFHANSIRAQLSDSNEPVTLAFFETLLCGTPVNAIGKLTQLYAFDDDGNVSIMDPDTPQQSDISSIKDLTAVQENTSQFVFDRVPFLYRTETSTRLRIVVEITEYDGTQSRFALEPRRYDAYVAHAVYAGIVADVEDCEVAAREFLKAYVGLWADQTWLASLGKLGTTLSEAAQKAYAETWKGKNYKYLTWRWRAFNSLYNWTVGWATKDYSKPPDLKPAQVEQMVRELLAVMRLAIPTWPEPATINEWEENRRREATAAEVRRVAADVTPGNVPPPAPTAATLDRPGSPSDELYALEEGHDIGTTFLRDRLMEAPPIAADEDSALQAVLPAVDDETFEEIRNPDAYQRTWRDWLKKPVLVEEDADYELEEAPPLPESQLKPGAIAIRRELPQIVRPKELKLFLQKPLDTASPDEYIGVREGAASIEAWFGALFTTVAVFAVSYTFIFDSLKGVSAIAAIWGWIETSLGAAAAAGAGGAAAGGAAVGVGAFAAPLWAPVALAMGGFWLQETVRAAVATYANRFRAVRLTIPFATQIGLSIITLSRNRSKDRNVRNSLYYKAVRHARGVPIEASLAAGAAALKLIAKRAKERIETNSRLAAIKVIYNESLDYRFRFFEYYVAPSESALLTKLNEVPLAYMDHDWASVPQSMALTLLPPADVVESLYEADELRRIPIADAVRRIVGRAPSYTPESVVSLAAAAAHEELIEIVRNGRLPFKGEYIMESVAQTALTLAEQGANIITAAYGAAAGVTLVTGQDPLWTCLPAGVAARIAVRHMTVFQRADALRKLNSEQSYKLAVHGWRMPQRRLLDAFALAWVARARAVASDSKKDVTPFPDRRALAMEATRSYARVDALREEADTTALMTVATTFATAMYESLGERKLSKEAVATHENERGKAAQFTDQDGLKPYNADRSRERMLAGWASRRIDVEVSREWETLSSDVTKTLFGKPDGATKHYYSPMGSRIEGLPGRVPWGIKDLGSRLVWVSALLTVVQRLRRSGVKYTSLYAGDWRTLLAKTVAPLGQGQGGLHGLSRHPLTVTANGNATEVAVSEARHYTREVYESGNKTDTLLNAINAFAESRMAGEFVLKRAEASRAAAFNADRLLAGMQLALLRKAPDVELHIILPHSDYIPALVFAMAMDHVEHSGIFTPISVHVPMSEHVTESDEHLVRIGNACSRAEVLKCKVVTLSEACVSLA